MDIFCSPVIDCTHTHIHTHLHRQLPPLLPLLCGPFWHVLADTRHFPNAIPSSADVYTHTHTQSYSLYPPSHTPWGWVEDSQEGSGGTTLFKLRLFWVVWPRGTERIDIGEKDEQTLHAAFIKSKCVCDIFLWYISVYVRLVFFPVPLGEHWRMFSVISVVSICCVRACTCFTCVCPP